MAIVPEYSDDELIRMITSGGPIDKAVKFLYENYFYVLSSYIGQHHGSREDAEDIFQETVLTFIELVQKGRFRGESSVRTFMYSINKNIWLNEIKKRGRQLKRDEKFGKEQQLEDEGVSKYISNRESRAMVYSIIDSLGEVCRKILLAFYYENLPISDILKRLDYQNEQVVRNKKAKCMKSLEEKFNADPALAQQFKSALQYE